MKCTSIINNIHRYSNLAIIEADDHLWLATSMYLSRCPFQENYQRRNLHSIDSRKIIPSIYFLKDYKENPITQSFQRSFR